MILARWVNSGLWLVCAIFLSACISPKATATSSQLPSPLEWGTPAQALAATIINPALPTNQPTSLSQSSATASTQNYLLNTPFLTLVPTFISGTPTSIPQLLTQTIGVIRSRISSLDGMTMVYIPAGDFLMGSVDGDGNKDEHPQHVVHLDAFWIDQTEVTNGMYIKCVNDGGCKAPSSNQSYTRNEYYGNPAFNNYPVIFVNWNQAQKYCMWAQRRLPTEAEWEKAARGSEGQIYPWGNQSPTDKIVNFDGNAGDTSQVGSYPGGASPFGALDMAGNVAEWVADWYGEYPSSPYPISNPQGPATGYYRILRGGSWVFSAYMIRSANRYWASAFYVDDDAGFRCAVSK